jgi:D-alanyl-D-alanine carboxypeptidase/D-alanyl-D-alanine-endopeptidase (penicillin-binding protein 4)
MIFTVLLIGVLCGEAQAALPVSVKRELKQAGIPQEAIAVVVQEAATGKSLLRMNAERSMNPASTMKLLTTYAALDQLGPAYTWKTEAYLDGELKDGVLQGSLVLKGYGDPKLTVEQFWLWLTELRARGLRDIRGDLVLDRSYFELPTYDAAAFDNDPVRAYNVGPDALLLNFNTLRLRYLPEGDKLNVVAEPPLEGIHLDNHLVPQSGVGCDEWDDGIRVQAGGDSVVFEGGYPGECGEREHSLSVMPHTRYVDAVFRALWKNLGGTLQGTMREQPVGGNAKLFSTHRSEPLSLTIRDINKFSNNVMARQLFLTLGANDHASIELSVQSVRAWLDKQSLDFPELVLENGAGLSRKERISAAHMAQLLRHAAAHPLSAELQASLPILGVDGTVKKRLKESPAASHSHLKTGTLSGVKTIAGYVRGKSGKEWIVVFFINHANAQRGQVAQDALIEWVQQKH